MKSVCFRSFLRLLALGFALAGCSNSNTKVKTKGNSVAVEKGSYKLLFQKQTALDETYMVFGIQTDSKEHYDGYVGGIPLDVVSELRKQYADIDSCNSAGSEAARGHVINFLLVGYSPEVKTAMRSARDMDLSAQRAGGDRICVHLRGHRVTYDSGAYLGMKFDINAGTGHENMISPESVAVVPCK
jgi:hypothetical protein